MHTISRKQPECREGQIPIAPDVPGSKLIRNMKCSRQGEDGSNSSANKSRDGIGSWNSTINPKSEYKMYKSVPSWGTGVENSWN